MMSTKDETKEPKKYGLREEKEITYGLSPEVEKRRKELESIVEKHKKSGKPLYMIYIQADDKTAIKDAMLLAGILKKKYHSETRLTCIASEPYHAATKQPDLLVHLIGLDDMAEKRESDPVDKLRRCESQDLVEDLCEYFDALAELGGTSSTILCISSEKDIILPNHTLYIDYSDVKLDKKELETALKDDDELEHERRKKLEDERRKYV